VHDLGRTIDLEEILQTGNATRDIVKGLKGLYKLETV